MKNYCYCFDIDQCWDVVDLACFQNVFYVWRQKCKWESFLRFRLLTGKTDKEIFRPVQLLFSYFELDYIFFQISVYRVKLKISSYLDSQWYTMGKCSSNSTSVRKELQLVHLSRRSKQDKSRFVFSECLFLFLESLFFCLSVKMMISFHKLFRFCFLHWVR